MSVLDQLVDLDSFKGDRGKFLLHGDPGTGKTTLATSIAEVVPTLYIDLPGEKGIHSVPRSLAKNIKVWRPQSVEDLDQMFWHLQNGEVRLRNQRVQAVVLESVSALQQMYVRYVQDLDETAPRKAARGAAKPRRKDLRQVYGEVVDYLKDFMTFWFSLADGTNAHPLHVIMTSQSRYREIREDGDGGEPGPVREVYIGPDVSPGSANAVEAPPNFIGHLAIEESDDLEALTPDGKMVFTVRFGPHPLIRTKLHQEYDAARRWPDVVGRDGKRLTLPKMMKFLGIPLK